MTQSGLNYPYWDHSRPFLTYDICFGYHLANHPILPLLDDRLGFNQVCFFRLDGVLVLDQYLT